MTDGQGYTVDKYGIQWRIGFHFAPSSFDKVVQATTLFEQGKAFVLSTKDDNGWIIYVPEYLSTIDRYSVDTMDCMVAMQNRLGIDLMCYDCVTELKYDDLTIGYTVKIEE